MICPNCGLYIVSHVPCRKCGYLHDRSQLMEDETEDRINDHNNIVRTAKGEDIESTKKEKFYDTEGFMWLMMLTLYPLGLILLWKNSRYTQNIRTVITLVLMLVFLIVHIGFNFMLADYATTNMVSKPQKEVQSLAALDEVMKEKIKFSNVGFKDSENVGIVQGEVTNHDSKSHSFSFSISLYDEEKNLITKASDAMINLEPQQTQSFRIVVLEKPQNAKYQKAKVEYFLDR